VVDDLAAGGLQRGGAGVGGEMMLAGEPADVADLTQERAAGPDDGLDLEEGRRDPGHRSGRARHSRSPQGARGVALAGFVMV
jgi:hypothetical protein